MSDRPLRLLAHDSDDLAVVTGRLQGADVLARDMAYLPKARRFAFVAARFNWLAADRGEIERVATGAHFDGVLSAATQGFDPRESDALLNLISIEFTPGEAPAGEVALIFSGGAEVRLRVECLDAHVRDLDARDLDARADETAPAARADD